jgi:hypothetical protein
MLIMDDSMMFWICSNQHRATQGWGWSHGSNNCTFNICFWSVKLEIHMELIKNVMCADRWAHPSWFNNAKSSQRIYIDLLYSNHQTKWIVIYQNYINIYIYIYHYSFFFLRFHPFVLVAICCIKNYRCTTPWKPWTSAQCPPRPY